MIKFKFKIFQFLTNKINKKRIIINFVIALLIVGFLLLIDLLTKSIFFNFPGSFNVSGETKYNIEIIAFRSQAHNTTTFSDLLKIDFSNLFIIIYSWIILIIIIFLIIFTRKKMFIIGFSFLSAGVLGNTIDRMLYNYVRNIFFTPWWDRGTFNFADTILVIGSAMTFIAIIYKIFFSNNKKER